MKEDRRTHGDPAHTARPDDAGSQGRSRLRGHASPRLTACTAAPARGDLGGRRTHGEDAGRPGRSDAARRARRRRQGPGGLAAADEPVRRDCAADPSRSPRWRALLRDQGVSAPPPSVSGWETGRVAPSTAVVEAYERALGLSPAPCAAPSTWCGAPSADRPVHRRRPGPGRRWTGPSSACSTTGPVTGAEWLHFCDAALAVRPGLPARLMRPLVDRLVSEIVALGVHGVPHPLRGSRAAALRRSTPTWCSRRCATTSRSPATRSWPRACRWSPSARPGEPRGARRATSASDDAGWLRGAVLGLENLHLPGG